MTLPHQIGVYGGGRMGAGIAHAFVVSRARVTVIESSDEAAGAARARIEASLSRAAERDHLPEGVTSTLARIHVSTNPGDLTTCGLVVEAVPEQTDLKKQILAVIEENAPDAWVGTNTSSLSVDELSSALRRPERLLGLHFFNPVPASTLVEVVVGTQTSAEVAKLARGWVSDLGKTAITVSDSPGFASSRLGVAIALEAMRMLEEGVASAEDIDTAMELGYKHPVGPLRTTDIVGLDVRLAIADHLARTVGERFATPQILRDKVAAGELGRKSGKGFYEWS